MARFTCAVTKTVTYEGELEVEADTLEEARDLAEDQADDAMFGEHTIAYEVSDLVAQADS